MPTETNLVDSNQPLVCDFCGGNEQVVIVVQLNKPEIKVCKHCYPGVKRGKASERIVEVTNYARDLEVLCDCEQLHPGQEISDGLRLRWYCTVEDEWKEDVNA